MVNKNEDIEVLDFEDEKQDLSKTDTLDLEDISNKKISSEIDNILDFTIRKDPSGLNELLSSEKEENKDTKIELDAKKEKLDEYKPSIKDFNIKSAKARKVVYKSMLYAVIIMLVGFEFFLNKSGNILRDLRVYASDNQPIKIVQNAKYGFIDKAGNVLINPKYNYADDFIKGYAIVKNGSNLSLIINKGGKEVIPSGTYFTIYRAGNDVVVSKATKKGLKYGILDVNLKEKVDFKYDSIYYSNGLFSYSKQNEVGLLNSDGKEIFSYKLTDNDSKIIDVLQSDLTDDSYDKYGVVKVNGTSQIINLKTGAKISSPTLNKVEATDNNVFYEINNTNQKRYMYVYKDKVLIESDSYKNISVPSIKSGVVKAIVDNYKYEFISIKNMEQIKKGLSIDDTYFGDDIFMYKERDYVKNVNNIVLVKEGEEIARVEGNYEVDKPFNNGYAVLKYEDGTYGYINSSGKFINAVHYKEANDFDSFGDAIIKSDGGYGVIRSNGKVIIEPKYSSILTINGDLKKELKSTSNNVFYAVKEGAKYLLYNSKGNRRDDIYYDNIIFNDKFPVFKASNETLDLIITSQKMGQIKIPSINMEYEAYENYIKVKNEYYNYNGKLIYTDNSKNGGD